MILPRLFVCCGVLAAATASCGPTVMQVCDDYATAWCTAQFHCAPAAAAATYGNVQQCVLQQESPQIMNCNAAQSICISGTSYDTSAAETCVSDTNHIGTTGLCSGGTECLSCADIANNQTPPSCAPNLICH